MTKLLERAIQTARALPPDQQDVIAREILALAADNEDEDEEDIDPADIDAIDRSLADVDAGRIATDEEVEAVFRKYIK
jgi:predicted transcriptional regulator